MIIAIDGPAGSGKSTVAKLVATRLGFTYLDTGAMYRAVACRAIATGVDLTEPLSDESIRRLADIAENETVDFETDQEGGLATRVFIGGIDVSKEIRTPEADRAVSPVSAEPLVRQALTEQQRRFGYANDTVMEGRDIATVVFPDAELKIFLTASPEERAKRRTLQNAMLENKEFDESEYQRTLTDITRRDEYDSSRQVAPLVPADDSVLIDSTDLSIEQVVERIVCLSTAHASPKPQLNDYAPGEKTVNPA